MKEKARGCLMGQLAGDAFGSQVEFKSAAEITSLFPDGIRTMSRSLTWGTLPGQITDDSEMALALARTIAGKKEYDKKAVRAAYAGWLRSNPFDCGNTVHSSLMGTPNPDSQANGALMRVSPLGIWGVKKDRQELWDAARLDAMLTHVNPVCQQVNQIFATLIAVAIGTPQSGKELYSRLCGHPEEFCDQPVLPSVWECIQRSLTEKPVLDRKFKGWVLLAFQNALYQLIHADTFESALIDTVMGGGDTDTNAAICGALMGALLGISAIPGEWSSIVLNCMPDEMHDAIYPRPKYYWSSDALSLADALLG